MHKAVRIFPKFRFFFSNFLEFHADFRELNLLNPFEKCRKNVGNNKRTEIIYLCYKIMLFFQAFRVDDDDFIYADSDYRDLYAYGPVAYTQTSRHAAQTKKDEFAKRYGTIGR